MKACGIDLGNPGGLVILSDDEPGRPGVVTWRRWAHIARMDLQILVHGLCREHQVGVLATERPFTGRGDRRPKVGLAQREKQGLVRAVAEHLQIRVVDYAPATIKAAVAGHGRAHKDRVGRCVRLLVDGLDVADEHVLDAAAIALVALSRERTRLRTRALRRGGGVARV